jgi:hypothetical protein
MALNAGMQGLMAWEVSQDTSGSDSLVSAMNGGGSNPTATPTARARARATATSRSTARPTATPRTRPRPTPTSGGGGTWAPNTFYAIGATVTYGGASYRCQQAHTSQVGWEPPNVPALWVRL